ncbi:hypothetical protein FQZ97_581170 [compost metagenome]
MVLRQACMPGYLVASEVPRLRASSQRNTMPMRPRPRTISPLLNHSEATFTTTLMVANRKAPSTIHSACID